MVLIHFSLGQFFFACTFFSIFPFKNFTLDPRTLVTSYVCFFFVLFSVFSDPGAVVETHNTVPYAVIGGVLALLVFTVICVLIVTIWCSVRQKGNTHTYIHTRSPNNKVSVTFITCVMATLSRFSVYWNTLLLKFSEDHLLKLRCKVKSDRTGCSFLDGTVMMNDLGQDSGRDRVGLETSV